jgi:hypothetical protein
MNADSHEQKPSRPREAETIPCVAQPPLAQDFRHRNARSESVRNDRIGGIRVVPDAECSQIRRELWR